MDIIRNEVIETILERQTIREYKKEQITEDELLEIKEKQKKVEEGLSASRAELDAALDRAETEAKAYLEALKAERLESARASVGG